MVLSLQIGTDVRATAGSLELIVDVGGELDKAALASLGLAKWRVAKEPLVAAGLSRSSVCSGPVESRLAVPIEPGVVSGAFVHFDPNARRKADKPNVDTATAETYTLVRVRQGDTKRGPGITYVVCAADPKVGGHRA